VALEEAARAVSRRYGARALSFTGHIAWEFLRGKYWPEMQERLKLSPEDAAALKDDAHAGQWETSMMLKLYPELVDPGYMKLSPFSVKMIERIRPNYPLKKGEQLGYVGHPARASRELADISAEFLLEKAMALIEEHLFAEKAPSVSMFYRIPLFRTNFLRALLILAILAALLFWLFR
jgi:creatinine amidohydrolase/Fe(II)-dependent formamide hydrolase-like protein